jgi:predicted TIM-barrel fold metal-dependent hydrolase
VLPLARNTHAGPERFLVEVLGVERLVLVQPSIYGADNAALLEAAPGPVVCGTEWPYVMVKGRMPNDGEPCDLLAEWVPDPALRQRVLVDNPATLDGF